MLEQDRLAVEIFLQRDVMDVQRLPGNDRVSFRRTLAQVDTCVAGNIFIPVQGRANENHRIGLFDAVLIKENHVAAVGNLTAAVAAARRLSPNVMIEVEVETLDQLREALSTDADRIMLDDFSLDDMRAAVTLRDAHAGKRQELEASGSVDAARLKAIAATGVDCISIGALTKHVRAIDFSMRFV
jgi:nicotinate-nucleotide pyrophosphorylase